MYVRSRHAGSPRRLQPLWVVAVAVGLSAVAHAVAAARGPAGPMGWLMTGMTILCLSCAAPLLSRSQANTVASWRVSQARKAAGHLLVMSGVMILVHLVILTSPESAGHHGAPSAGGVVEDHHVAMLALMAVELLCLMTAAVALRLCRVAQVAARSPVASYPSSDLVENWT